VKAKVNRLLAHIKFIEAFHYSVSDGDQVEVFLTNLKIAKQRIQSFHLQGPLDQFNKSPTTKEDTFEMKI